MLNKTSPALLKSVIVFFAMINSAFATLDIELTQGIDAKLPIAVVPFAGAHAKSNPIYRITDIIRHDLDYSGRFSLLPVDEMAQYPSNIYNVNRDYWHTKKVDDLVIGEITPLADQRYRVKVSLIDLYTNQATRNPENVYSRSYVIDGKDVRRLAHRISDELYQRLTGERGVFSTHMAYVTRQSIDDKHSLYQLEMADADGENPRPLVRSAHSIMSPSWSPDNKFLSFVSFENGRSEVFVQQLATGKRDKIASYHGINSAPAWSPDGHKLALVSSKSGKPKIYAYDLETRELKQLTYGLSIDTEPMFSRDGRSIVFTSNRGGSPQIYRLTLASHNIERLTFEGRYNASPKLTPNGKQLVMLHRDEEGYAIAVQDLQSGELTKLTPPGRVASPSVAPNGRLVLYSTIHEGKGELSLVSIDGRIRMRLPSGKGEVREPAWSPYPSAVA